MAIVTLVPLDDLQHQDIFKPLDTCVCEFCYFLHRIHQAITRVKSIRGILNHHYLLNSRYRFIRKDTVTGKLVIDKVLEISQKRNNSIMYRCN